MQLNRPSSGIRLISCNFCSQLAIYEFLFLKKKLLQQWIAAKAEEKVCTGFRHLLHRSRESFTTAMSSFSNQFLLPAGFVLTAWVCLVARAAEGESEFWKLVENRWNWGYWLSSKIKEINRFHFYSGTSFIFMTYLHRSQL